MTALAIDKDGKAMPTSYAGLAKRGMPRPIHSDEELAKAWKVIERLAGFELTADQDDYLDLVSNLIAAYEQKRFASLNRKVSAQNSSPGSGGLRRSIWTSPR